MNEYCSALASGNANSEFRSSELVEARVRSVGVGVDPHFIHDLTGLFCRHVLVEAFGDGAPAIVEVHRWLSAETDVGKVHTEKAREKLPVCSIRKDLGFAGTRWWRMQSDANESQPRYSLLSGKIAGILRKTCLRPPSSAAISSKVQRIAVNFPLGRTGNSFDNNRDFLMPVRDHPRPANRSRQASISRTHVLWLVGQPNR